MCFGKTFKIETLKTLLSGNRHTVLRQLVFTHTFHMQRPMQGAGDKALKASLLPSGSVYLLVSALDHFSTAPSGTTFGWTQKLAISEHIRTCSVFILPTNMIVITTVFSERSETQKYLELATL
jgi:hypothetical protein